ncbi:SUKH-4 family immunity protein [Streptomyces albulus]|uniref:SUKH-4 family immunity protein n=1 Tax=Streptomyces noursei TaxID=1971 RepID=UPI001F42C33E|nr:SUKH-4 family immunity protein [Streptomyces noursei]MCE4948324.1 SUKH-4 family immunity protein [Streptomyces noursei]
MNTQAQAGTTAQPPVTGPGNTAVATYLDPSTGEETSLAQVSRPGLPPAEYQLFDALRQLGVDGAAVRAVHTDLRPAMLPGGYTGDFVLRAFPNAAFSCTTEYGTSPEERAAGIAGLVQQVETMHRLAGRQAPPQPHRIPAPRVVAPAPALPTADLGAHLTEVFGAEGVRRPDAGALAAGQLPEDTRTTLTEAGLPARVPYFFTADDPAAPPAGGLFADVATHLRGAGTQAPPEVLDILAGYVRVGTDGLYTLAVQCTAPEDDPNQLGTLWAVQPSTGGARFVNRSLAAYLRSLTLLVTTRRQLAGLDPYAAGAAVAAFQEQLVALDAWSLDDPDNWWSLVTEQMWHGLF